MRRSSQRSAVMAQGLTSPEAATCCSRSSVGNRICRLALSHCAGLVQQPSKTRGARSCVCCHLTHGRRSDTYLCWSPCTPAYHAPSSCFCERRVQAARTVRSSPPRSGILQRRSERRCQGWRGAECQWSDAPPAGLDLDGSPPGAILPDRLGGMASTKQRATGERRGRRNAVKSFYFARPTAGRRRAGGRADWVSRPSTLTRVDSELGKEID